MKYFFLFIFLFLSSLCYAQMLNDSPFIAKVAHPKYKLGQGPSILIDAAHHNFIVEMGLIKPLVDVLHSDGYKPKIDSQVFSKPYLSKYKILVIMPAMPFEFGSKNIITDEVTFTKEELNALHEWVEDGGSLLMLSEHAPIDKSMTPLFNKFGLSTTTGIIYDSVYCDTSIKIPSYQMLIQYTSTNGLLNTKHPITMGQNSSEAIHRMITYGGSGITGKGYTNIFQTSSSATVKKWSGNLPSGMVSSQCMAGPVGKGKLVALGDCNGFTAMYMKSGGKKISAGMQVANYDWKQFVLNTFHWLSN
jgi:hypothetical protein